MKTVAQTLQCWRPALGFKQRGCVPWSVERNWGGGRNYEISPSHAGLPSYSSGVQGSRQVPGDQGTWSGRPTSDAGKSLKWDPPLQQAKAPPLFA